MVEIPPKKGFIKVGTGLVVTQFFSCANVGNFLLRSDVFAAMFSHPETKENKNNVVEVEDAEPDTIEQVRLTWG